VDGGKDYENTREPVTIDPVGGGRIVQISTLEAESRCLNPAFAGAEECVSLSEGYSGRQKGDAKGRDRFFSSCQPIEFCFGARTRRSVSCRFNGTRRSRPLKRW
jgi:hypothetical protein